MRYENSWAATNAGARQSLLLAMLCAGICGFGAVVAPAAAQFSPPPGPPEDITPAAAARLTLVFSFRVAQPGGYTGAPAVGGDTLFWQTPFPHTVYALNPAHQDDPVRWRVTPDSNSKATSLACCDVTTGGPVIAAERLYVTTLDGQVIALDTATGQPVWTSRPANVEQSETLTAAPVVAAGRVFVGSTGDDFGVRGWVAALDASTGALLWKRYATGPDADVGIGPEFKTANVGTQLGIRTWPPDGWLHGGGGLAGGLVYDADADKVLHGTGHPAPWNPDARPGDNRWTSGLFARDAATGAARWFDPIAPHDLYALGAHGSLLAADIPWHGTQRKLLLHPDANGFVYVLDRATGDVLSAQPFAPGNAINGIDLATGTPQRDPSTAVQPNVVTRDICPGWPGATGGGAPGAAAAAFLPATGLLYIPVSRLCMDFEPRDANYIAGTPFTGANLRIKPGRGVSRGALVAWDVAGARPAWTIDEPFPVIGGVLATSGGVVFYGTLDGLFKAVDAQTGRLLWQYRTASGIVGQPISFRLSDQRQYVAVAAGVGGVAGRVAQSDIDVRDATAARGFANAVRDLKPPSDRGGTLYVFALP